MTEKGLSGNQLKLIAMIAMTADHVGLMFFPESVLLRLIGRLAFPIYAYMIGEGCRHTRSMGKYFGSVAIMAFACQLVYWFAQGSLYQSILVTFSLSIALCMLAKMATERGGILSWIVFGVGTAAVLFVTEFLPALLPGTDYGIDYGFWGVLIPAGIYLAKNKTAKLSFAAGMLLLISYQVGSIQLYSLLALPLLALYNGQRGRWKLKYLFYIYYPAHLAALYLIAR